MDLHKKYQDNNFLKSKGVDKNGVVLLFLKKFVVKYFTSVALEKIVIILLRELVKRTDSKVDDELFETVFTQTKEGSK